MGNEGNATGMEIKTEIGTHGELYDKSGRPGCRANYWSRRTEPAVGRLVNGLPARVDRLKGLGNAIVPQIAELLFIKIIDNQRRQKINEKSK